MLEDDWVCDDCWWVRRFPQIARRPWYYSVPPPSIIPPTTEQLTGNHTDVQPTEFNPDVVDLDIEVHEDDPIFGPNENEWGKYLWFYW